MKNKMKLYNPTELHSETTSGQEDRDSRLTTLVIKPFTVNRGCR